MGASLSTTLVLVGNDAPTVIGALGRFSNVRAAVFDDHDDAEVNRWVSGAHAPYVAHDRDPLGHVAGAWVEFFDEAITLETLDLEVDRVVSAFARGEVTMPDYYLVVGADRLSPTWKHWWLGILAQAAPTRVIPWDSGSSSLSTVLRTLPASRPWPEPGPWLHAVARAIPGELGRDGYTTAAV